MQKPTQLEAIRCVAEHFSLSMSDAIALLRVPIHPHGLRDTFAGQAMQALLTRSEPQEYIKSAYVIADLMLEQRLKEK